MIRNTTRSTVLARRFSRAETFWSRFAGLMGKKEFPEKYEALVFEKCSSIHCFFMRMTIDAVFVDKEKRVVRCFPFLAPWHLAFGGGKSVDCIELPAGTLEKSGTLPGDQLVFEEDL